MTEHCATIQAKNAPSLHVHDLLLQRKCVCGKHTPGGGECTECAKNRGRLQHKLRIGANDDPLEAEADHVADEVMSMPAHFIADSSPPRIHRRTTGADSEQSQAPDSVERILASPGRSLDPTLRADMEQRFGHDFSTVRTHSDSTAQRSASEVNATAYTVGRNIVFADGQYAPQTHQGRKLIAHELTHVVQQGSGALLQRQSRSGSTNSVGSAAQGIIDAAKDSKATPATDRRATNAVWAILRTYYTGEVGKISEVVYDENDRGLTTSPVGNGATLTGRISVGKYFLDHIDSFARRVLQVGHELQHVDQQRGGMGGPAHQNEREFLAYDWEALQEPKAGTGRLGAAMRRDMIDCALGHYYCLSAQEQQGFDAKKLELLKERQKVNGRNGNPPTDAPIACKPCSTGNRTRSGAANGGGTGAAASQGSTGQSTSSPTTVAANDLSSGSNQWSGSAGMGFVEHKYLTQPGATDPAREAVVQLVGAYTRQFHADGKNGLELQTPAQLQVSLTTGHVSVAGGGQLSYVIPFADNQWQWSAFAQVLGGYDITGSSVQLQPAVGTQISFQPRKWMQVSAQGSSGGTAQTNGPASLDYGGAITIQFMH